MKRALIRLCVAPAVLMALPALAHGDNASVKKELLAAYNRRYDLLLKRDSAGAADMLMPDFAMKTAKAGWVKGKDGYIHMMEQDMESSKPTDPHTFTIESLSTHGKQAVATVTTIVTRTRAFGRGKPQVAVLNNTIKETWVKTPQGWKSHSIEDLRGHYTYNGRIMSFYPPGKMPAP